MSLTALLLAAAATAPLCQKMDAALPPVFAKWAGASPFTQNALNIGRPAILSLQPGSRVRYAAKPEKPDAPDRFGGVFRLSIAKAGRYAVALGAAAWIDVVRDGKPLLSISHQHGPDCTSIRKIVVFDLKPGTYRLQLSNSPTTTPTLEIVPWP